MKKSWNTLTALALAVLISLFQVAYPIQVQATGPTQEADDVAAVTINGITIYYDNMDSAFQSANGQTATITLLKDASLSSSFTINAGTDITLAGEHTLSGSYPYVNDGTLSISAGT